jgi:transposase-like protein
MSSESARLALADVIEQGWKQLQGGLLQQLKKTIEGLLTAERDRRVAERRERGEKVYRWGFTVRKSWQTAWGALEQVRVPRLRGREEIGLLEKYQRHALQEVLFALAVGGLSQRKVVSWVRRFLGGQLSPASIGAVLRAAQEQIQGRRQQRLTSGMYRALAVDGIYLRYRRSAKSAARNSRSSTSSTDKHTASIWSGTVRGDRPIVQSA